MFYFGDCTDYGTGTAPGETDCEAAGGVESWIGDGYCDGSNNNAECDYDGGDCCEDTCVDGTYDCDTFGGCEGPCLYPYGSDDACDTVYT